MTFELVYRSSKGNKNYWTTKHHFTRKESDHYQWETIQRMNTEFPQLKFNYPTLFANKKIERFYYLDLESKNLRKLVPNKPKSSSVNVSNEDYQSPLKSKDRKYYAIAIDIDNERHYFNANKGIFIKEFGEQVRRWKELDKAIATANAIRSNKKVLAQYPELKPLANYVVNLKTGVVVWPDNVSLVKENDTDQITIDNPVIMLMKLEQLQGQLTQNFSDNNNFPVNDRRDSIKLAQINFEKFNAQKTFEALSYLVTVMSPKQLIDKLLKSYDKGLLQDYLHTIELANLESFDADSFAKHLQLMRQDRRQVKNLALILDVLARNIDLKEILKQLLQEPSLKNQYHYRHKETGKLLLRFLDSNSEEPLPEDGRGGEV